VNACERLPSTRMNWTHRRRVSDSLSALWPHNPSRGAIAQTLGTKQSSPNGADPIDVSLGNLWVYFERRLVALYRISLIIQTDSRHLVRNSRLLFLICILMLPLVANPSTRLSGRETNSQPATGPVLAATPLPGTPIVESSGKIVFPASTTQNHWWMLDYWDASSSGGSLPSDLSGQFVAVANTIVGLEQGDGILYLPVNVAYGTSASNCVWFQFDVYFDSSGSVSWFIWDVNCPGTDVLTDYHYTTIGLSYTPGDHYSFAIVASGSNTVTFSINDTSAGSSWSNSNWLWPISSTTLLATEGTFSPASAVEGYTTNSSLTGVPVFETKLGDGIATNRNYETGTGMPSGIATTRATLSDSSHYLWSMGPVAEFSGTFCGTVGGADLLICNGLSPTSIGLDWGESGYGILCFGSYQVQESTTGPNGNWTTVDSQGPIGNFTDYVQNLTPGQTYWWREIDHGCLGLSATSNVLQATQPHVAILSYEATSDTGYQFTWSNNANYTNSLSFSSYQLEESVNGRNYSPVYTSNSVDADSSIQTLSSATSYSFFVVTTDKCSGSGLGSGCPGGALTSTSDSTIVYLQTPPTLTALAQGQTGPFDIGQPAAFTCNAAGGASPYNYSWAFGDGLTGTGQSVTHSYSSTGTMSVVCTVTDSLSSSVLSLTSTMIISDPTVAIPQPSHPSMDEGQTVEFVTQATGGSGGYVFTWLNLPKDCVSSDTDSIACTATVTGSYMVEVNVTDSNKFSVMSSPLAFVVYSDPTITSANSTPSSLDLGQETIIAIYASGGYGILSYSYSGLPSGCTTASTAPLACVPTETGTYSITVTVVDQNGFSVTSNPFSIVTNPDPAATLHAIPSETDVDEQITLSVSASLGTGHYSYAYQDLPLGCSTSNSTTLACTPLTAGSYTIEVTMTDAVGGTGTSTVNITVNSEPSISSFTSSPSSVSAGQQTIFSVSTSGGTAPISYTYTGLPPGCTSTSTAKLSCTPSTSGTYLIVATVTDKVGKTATSFISINVSPRSTVLGLSPLEGYSAIAGIVVAVLAGGVAALLQLRKRETSPS
jgi:PKD domain